MNHTNHLTPGEILLALDGELESEQSAAVTAHLESCWSCRARCDRVRATTHQLVDYRELLMQRAEPPSAAGRVAFLASIGQAEHSGRPMLRLAWTWLVRTGRQFEYLRRPRIATGLAVAVVLVIVVGPARTWAAVRDLTHRAVSVVAATLTPRSVERPPLAGTRPAVVVSPPTPTVAVPRITKPSATPRKLVDTGVLLGLELQVLSRLQRVGALMGEQVSVERRADRVRVEALAESASRQAELEAALASLRNAGLVELDIRNAQQGATYSSNPTERGIILRDVEVIRDRIASHDRLYRFFTLRRDGSLTEAPADHVDEQIRRFADRVLTRSRDARYHAIALQRLLNRFEPTELRNVNATAFAEWRALIANEARSIVALAELLRLELAPVFAPGPMAGGFQPSGDEATLAEQLVGRTTLIHNAVRNAFVVSVEGGRSLEIETDTFWRNFTAAESLASVLAQ